MSTNSISALSSATLSKAAALQAQIERLQSELANLLGSSGAAPPAAAKRGRRKMSAAVRKRMSQVARARWKKAKAAGKTTL
jgi:ElaB/YqjD/DUF883 family membrane-anchored ribosome-binding protein